MNRSELMIFVNDGTWEGFPPHKNMRLYRRGQHLILTDATTNEIIAPDLKYKKYHEHRARLRHIINQFGVF